MRTSLAVMCVALAAGACTSSGGTKATGTPTPTVSPTPAPSATPLQTTSPAPATAADIRLERSLVRVADLPTGYTRDAVTRGTRLAASASDSTCAKRFAALDALQTIGPLTPVARARVSFSRGATGPFLRATAIRYSNPAAAAKVVKAVDVVFRSCPSFTATNPVNKRLTTVRLTPLAFPHVGDEGVAVGGRLVSGGKGVDIDLVFVRKGAALAYVAEITTGAGDVPALERSVRAEVSRLATAR